MNTAERRRKSQLYFLTSRQEIEVGNVKDLPVSVAEIEHIDEYSECVEQVFSSGLTAIVYKLKIDGKYYNLKKKRKEILVLNTDGQTSFLNEIQRRLDFEEAKKHNPENFRGIVETIYASLTKGFILSEWIEGEFITHFSKDIFSSIFQTLFEVEKIGLFECDLSLPNMLVDNNNRVHFFDFGYMYPYNPLQHFNSDGKEIPIFHMAERLESRCLMQYLMDIENHQNINSALNAFKITKESALEIYIKKAYWLEKNMADNDVIVWQKHFIQLWENGLCNQDNLNDLYELESFRSYVLDVYDDVSGKSCTRATLQKADKILQKITNHYDFLKKNQGLFWGDELLDRSLLIKKYENIKSQVVEYQLH